MKMSGIVLRILGSQDHLSNAGIREKATMCPLLPPPPPHPCPLPTPVPAMLEIESRALGIPGLQATNKPQPWFGFYFFIFSF